MTEKELFFEENDRKVCEKLTRISVWLTFVFPILFLLTTVKVFSIPVSALLVLSPIGCIGTIGPRVLYKLGVPTKAMKYISILSLGFVVMLLGGQWSIGIYMTYGLAMAFSCLFFDPKFTLRISILSFVFLTISVYMRSIDVPQIENPTNFEWFIGRMIGFAIEQVVMTLVFISVAKASRSVLENLHDKEKIGEIVKECGDASGELVNMMNELEGNIGRSRDANKLITTSAKNTVNGCEESRTQVKSIQDSVDEMNELIVGIYDHTGDITKISGDISDRTAEVVETMDIAADSMKLIEDTSNKTGASINELENGIQEIFGFVDQISSISAQTNLLALNASIEAARAGEQGKGFAVVAENVRVLAENSKTATEAIAGLVDRVREMLNDVKLTNEQNASSVMNGIEKIAGAKERTESLDAIRAVLNEKTEEISNRTEATKKHSELVKELAASLDMLVAGFSDQAKEIMEEAENEDRITVSTAEAFGRVKAIANELAEVSQASS